MKIGQIEIGDKKFQIVATKHAAERMSQRKVDTYKIIAAVLGLGEGLIENYKDSGRDIFVKDEDNNISVVTTIEGEAIVIITVIDKIDCWVKRGTLIVNL